MADTVDKLAFLALGWLLGLLGPIVVDAIKRKRESALGRAAILSELTELGGILSTAAYRARMRLGMADRPFLESLKSTLEQYATTPRLQAFIPQLRTYLSWTDGKLRLDDRYDCRATLITSQLPLDQWHAALGDRTVADAILDRLVHNAYKLELKEDSIRKRKSINSASMAAQHRTPER